MIFCTLLYVHFKIYQYFELLKMQSSEVSHGCFAQLYSQKHPINYAKRWEGVVVMMDSVNVFNFGIIDGWTQRWLT